MKGAGKQQEAEHDIQQHFAEVDAADKGFSQFCRLRKEQARCNENNGKEKRNDHHADGFWQFQQPCIEIGKGGSDNNQYGDDGEQAHSRNFFEGSVSSLPKDK